MPIDPAEIRATSIEGLRLPIGAVTDQVLREEIQSTPVFLALVSDASLDSAYVLFELGARWGLDRPLLPLVPRSDQLALMKGPLHGINALRCDNASDLHQLLSDISPRIGLTLRDPKLYETHIKTITSTATLNKPSEPQPKSRPRGFVLFGGFLTGLLGLVAFALTLALWFAESELQSSSVSLVSAQSTIDAQHEIILILRTPAPTSATTQPSPTAQPTPTTTPPLIPTRGSSVPFPNGGFLMGSNTVGDGHPQYPEHLVTIDAFVLADHEVTNAEYLACVASGACTAPASTASNSRATYFGNADFAAYPVIRVSFFQALDYCRWAGGDLPTEEQWERAARGSSARTYPWGEPTPAPSSAALGPSNTDTSPIYSHPFDQTPDGIFDLAGNVSEWTNSWYMSYPDNSPSCDFTNRMRVVRGGSYANERESNYPKTFHRSGRSTYLQDPSIGFRCAWQSP